MSKILKVIFTILILGILTGNANVNHKVNLEHKVLSKFGLQKFINYRKKGKITYKGPVKFLLGKNYALELYGRHYDIDNDGLGDVGELSFSKDEKYPWLYGFDLKGRDGKFDYFLVDKKLNGLTGEEEEF